MAVYFDNNATTPLDPEVLEAMMPFYRELYANPSSVYSTARRVREAVDVAREQVAALVYAHPSQVIFCSGGTEANNLAIQGVIRGMEISRMALSPIEHPSVDDTAKSLRNSCSVELLDVNSAGQVIWDSVDKFVQKNRHFLLSVMLANNETGCIQSVQNIAKHVRSANGFMHTDAVQAAGKMDVDFNVLGVHLMTLSSHKIYGPKGAGALVYDKALDISPIIFGGGQEKSFRSGTENVAAIVGFGKAAELAKKNLEQHRQYLLRLRNRFETQLKEIAGMVLFAEEAERLPNTTYFSLIGIDGETLVMQLDTQGFEVASGSACGSTSLAPSHVLTAMGIEESIARGAIRVSFGLQNTIQQVDDFISLLKKFSRITTSH